MDVPAKKAVVLISGGLDSTLAAKIMLEQGVHVVGVYLSAPWGCCDKTKAMKVARQLGIEFLVIKLTQEYIEVIRKPKYGYGSSMNPCVDCRIYMFHKAKEVMAEVGASFIVTGEVVSQRPMSQMRGALKIIETDSGLHRLIVRPLSAQVLPVTIPEEQGLVDRSKMYGIIGRSRKPQMKLALKYGILDYPNAAGGCLLTDQEFGNRVRDLFLHQEKIDLDDMELLRVGRHFRVNDRTKLIVGRNEAENTTLTEYLGPGGLLFVAEEFPGPSILLQGPPDEESRQLALGLMTHYSRPEKRPFGARVTCRVGMAVRPEGGLPQSPLLEEKILLGESVTQEQVEKMKI